MFNFLVPTMRGDIEILLYNIVQWLCGTIPWEKNLNDPSWVQQQKESAFKNTKKFLQECFKTSEIPAAVSEFTTLLASMKYNDTPQYDKFRDILVKGLKKLNHVPTGKLEFSAKKIEKGTPRKTTKVATEPPSSAKKSKAAAAPSPAASAVKTPSKSPRGRRNIPSANDSLNDSIDSIVMEERCMSGKDMRRKLLENIDGDAEYYVQIKKRKTKTSASSNGITPTKPPAKRGRKKVEKPVDLTISDSEPEVKIILCSIFIKIE